LGVVEIGGCSHFVGGWEGSEWKGGDGEEKGEVGLRFRKIEYFGYS
jgi:hypothetical protein